MMRWDCQEFKLVFLTCMTLLYLLGFVADWLTQEAEFFLSS